MALKLKELKIPIFNYTVSFISGDINEAVRYLEDVEEVENDEEFLILRHMVLSHHGKLEYGSPVLPVILEAEVMYLIDNRGI